MNKKLDIVRPELYPVPVKSPWYHIGMDFIGPIYPTSSSGNRFILTISDYFTKFAWAKALPTKEASNVVRALREVSFTYINKTDVHDSTALVNGSLCTAVFHHWTALSSNNRSGQGV